MLVYAHSARSARLTCGPSFRSMFKSKPAIDHRKGGLPAICARRGTVCYRLQVLAKSSVNSAAETPTQQQCVFLFGVGSDVSNRGQDPGAGNMQHLLGGKGQNLADMSRIGLCVPPGFTVTTAACVEFHNSGTDNSLAGLPVKDNVHFVDHQLLEEVRREVMSGLCQIEDAMGARFGDENQPLLVSVRSGAEVSMPGMMDTVLNVGLNDTIVQALASKAGAQFAWDSYRRFLEMFGSAVVGLEHSAFEDQLEAIKYDVYQLLQAETGTGDDHTLSAEQLKEVVRRYKHVYHSHGHAFPEQPEEQLWLAIQAAFRSWESEPARLYRRVNHMQGMAGMAVTVQAMVFGNLGNTSGTGVCFTRNPSTGKNQLYGASNIQLLHATVRLVFEGASCAEYLVNAQGEDVVTGVRTPFSIEQMCNDLPEAYQQLNQNCRLLEREYKDMQDIEFTVQEGSLYMLQCRRGKRTGAAAVAIACDFVDAGLVGIPDAVMMVEPRQLDQLLQPQFASGLSYADSVIAQGVPASPGAAAGLDLHGERERAVGRVIFDSATCERMAADGQAVILVRRETAPDDVKAMHGAVGVLTQLGGITSHAAVVTQGWGKPCITGCNALAVNEASQVATLGSRQICAGDVLSLNGTTGEVVVGAAPVAPPRLKGSVQRFLSWVDEYRTMGVLANTDTPTLAMQARGNGADGLCIIRKESMFCGSDERVAALRHMMLASTSEQRTAALVPIEELEQGELEGVFQVMDGLPVTVRLALPGEQVLAEFVAFDGVLDLANEVRMTVDEAKRNMEAMQDEASALNSRGWIISVAYPEIICTQVKAIIKAACAAQSAGALVLPGIMVPPVSSLTEYHSQVQLIHKVVQDTLEELGSTVKYEVGAIIDTPGAILLAGEMAAITDFFCFETDLLTETTYGISKDSVDTYLNTHINGISSDPFQVLDTEAIGLQIKNAILQGRAVNKNLKVGLCGGQGSERTSIAYLSSFGVDYVSCSPFRVPIARLNGAQAVIIAERSQ